MTVAETFAAPTTGSLLSPSLADNIASSSTDLPTSASIEGTRTVRPFVTTNCLPPVLITAYDICLSPQTRKFAIEKSIIIGISAVNGKPSRAQFLGPGSVLVFCRFAGVLSQKVFHETRRDFASAKLGIVHDFQMKRDSCFDPLNH